MDWIWSEWFWMPEKLTWEDFKSKDGIQTPDFDDLLIWPCFIMIVLLVLRKAIIIPLVFAPFGKYMGMRSKPISPPPRNDELEKLYKVNRARPPQNLLERYAKEINMAERQVERWLRRKALSQQKTTLEKFSDVGWEFTYYTCYCIFGLLVVATQSWCYDLEQSVENYPKVPISQGLWWYFMIGFGFYLGQTYTLLTGTKRFDFYLMLTHHVCTMSLMIFCWLLNLVRLGALTLLVHECADITLALGKIVFYCGLPRAANLMSIPFCLVWFPTRLVIYPFHVLRGCLFVAPRVVESVFPAYYLLNTLMISLLVMHVVWSYEIIKAIIIKFKRGVHLNDRFSPDEMSEEEKVKQNETPPEEGNLAQNGILRHNEIFSQKHELDRNGNISLNGTIPRNGTLPRNGTQPQNEILHQNGNLPQIETLSQNGTHHRNGNLFQSGLPHHNGILPRNETFLQNRTVPRNRSSLQNGTRSQSETLPINGIHLQNGTVKKCQ